MNIQDSCRKSMNVVNSFMDKYTKLRLTSDVFGKDLNEYLYLLNYYNEIKSSLDSGFVNEYYLETFNISISYLKKLIIRSEDFSIKSEYNVDKLVYKEEVRIKELFKPSLNRINVIYLKASGDSSFENYINSKFEDSIDVFRTHIKYILNTKRQKVFSLYKEIINFLILYTKKLKKYISIDVYTESIFSVRSDILRFKNLYSNLFDITRTKNSHLSDLLLDENSLIFLGVSGERITIVDNNTLIEGLDFYLNNTFGIYRLNSF